MPERDPFEQGRRAMESAEWEAARRSFERALELHPTPEAREGLGWALWWLELPEESFEHRQAAYRLYMEQRRPREAARVAIGLAPDIADFHGSAVGGGWLRRARTLLEESESAAEHGWLALWEGHFARLYDQDLDRARERAERASSLAREHGASDLELLAAALEGVTRVSEGDIREGMRRLDEATAATLSGEVRDLDAAGQTCCILLHACAQVRDFERATQWTRRASEFSRRWNIRPLYAVCRLHFAEVELGRGEWQAAEDELTRVLAEAPEIAYPVHCEAKLLLGELRRRQGRLDDAARLFDEVEGWSLSMLGRAAIALERGDPAAAVTLARQGLRTAAHDNWTLRAGGMARLVRALAEVDEPREAEVVAAELDRLARELDNDFVAACSRLAAGRIASARGEVPAARHALEEAADTFSRAGAPYEEARVRLELATALIEGGRPQLAQAEARAACTAFERLGAERDRLRAAELSSPSPVADPRRADAGPLSEREREVLSLVADGLSDKEVAQRLGLSAHTVHRHVANILAKLDAPSRTAAVASAVRRGLI